MSKVPTFSIVTPSYNQADFIETTMKSILDQAGDFKVQYIVADGGSTDNSVELIKRIADQIARNEYPINCKGVTLEWWSHKDEGQSDAINQGWAKCTGDYIAYLNSDDVYLPGAMERARLAFEKFPEAGAVYSSWIDIDAKGNELERHTGVTKFDLDFQLNIGNILPQPATFIRKKALDTIGLLNPKYHYAMDYDLWTRMGKKYSLEYVGDEYWAGFRLHDTSKTVTSIDKFWKEVREISLDNGGKYFSWQFFNHWVQRYPLILKPAVKAYRIARLLLKGDFDGIKLRFQRRLRR